MRIAVIDDYQRVAREVADWSVLAADHDVEFFHDHLVDIDELAARLAPFDAIIAMRERTAFPQALLDRLPSLRLLVATGMHHSAIDFAAARDRGVVVCGTESWLGATATIELTWGLILALVRNVHVEDAAIRRGGWQVAIGPLLQGKTLGIVGLGNLGSLMPPVARALGMRAVAWSRNLTDGRAREVGVERLDYEEFFRASDVVTVHLKLSERSVSYIGAHEIALMKPTAYLVNTSRGPVVDEAALIAALRTHRIAGAALDVFDREPLPDDHPLRSLPNTLVSPHAGYVTVDSYRDYYRQAIEGVLAFVAGWPLRVLGATAP